MSKKHMLKSAVLLYSLFSLSLLQAKAESFDFTARTPLYIEDLFSTSTATASIGDILEIALPENRELLQGIELLIKVPRVAASSREKIGWKILEGVFEPADGNEQHFTGKEYLSGTFSNTLSVNIKIPFKEANTIKKDPYSIFAESIPDIQNSRLFLSLEKPSNPQKNLRDASFEINARPILEEKGILKVSIKYPNETEKQDDIAPYSCFIDGIPCTQTESNVLTVGEHLFSLQSEQFRSQTLSFSIEKGKETYLELELIDIIPTIRVSAPSGTIMYIDGQETAISGEYETISEGLHIFKFTVGDYEMTRSITTLNGRSYTISLMIDALISED